MKLVQSERLLFPEVELSECLIQFQDHQSSQLLDKPNDAVNSNRTVSHTHAIPSVAKQQAAVVASIALAISCASTAKIIQPVPEYEGKFQIAVDSHHPANYSVWTPRIEDVNQNIEMALDYEAQIRVLKTPRVINPVVDQLRAQGVVTDYTSLTNQLHITHRDNSSTIEVSYRASDLRSVQLVLRQIAQAYLQEGQNCQTTACQGSQFVEAQLPELKRRVNDLQVKLQAFQQQYGVTNPDIQGRQLSFYVVQVAKQEADIQVKLDQIHDQYKMLQSELAIEVDQANAINLLNQDPAYRVLLGQLQAIDNQMIDEYSRPQIRNDKIQTLHEAYQKQLALLYSQASKIQPSSNPITGLQDPLWKQPTEPQLLQQWISTACYLQVLQVRQQTIAQVKDRLNQRVGQWAVLAKDYAEIQQQLQTATVRLNQYLAQRQSLQAQARVQEVEWSLAAPPEITRQEAGRSINIPFQLNPSLAAGLSQ